MKKYLLEAIFVVAGLLILVAITGFDSPPQSHQLSRYLGGGTLE